MMTLLPMAAFAASSNTALTIPTLKTSNSAQNVGQLRLLETEESFGSIADGHQITLTLPEGAKFHSRPTTTTGITASNIGPGSDVAPTISFVGATDRSITFQVGRAASPAQRLAINVDFRDANLAVVITGVSGAFEVDVFSANGGVTNGKVTVANIVSGATGAYALDTKDVKAGENGEEIGALRLIETTPGSLGTNDKVRLTLPADVKWNGNIPSINLSGGWSTGDVTVVNRVYTNTSGNSYIEFNVNTPSTSARVPGVMEIYGLKVNVDEKRVHGDIEVTVGGDATSTRLVLAKVVDYGYDLRVKEVKTVYLGSEGTDLEDFFIKERTSGSIIPGRTLKVTLPEGFIWVDAPAVSRTKGDNIGFSATGTLSEDMRTVSYTGSGTFSNTTAAEFKFAGGKIASKLDNKFAGDVNITFEGNTNVTGELTVATAVTPLSVEGNMSNTIIGKQNQPLNDITIKEVEAEKITARVGTSTAELRVFLPEGFAFSKTPSVEVIEGDLVLDTKEIKRAGSNGQLVIPVKRSSTVASTLKVSGIEVTIDRTPAEGDYEITVGGSSVNRAHALLNATQQNELDTGEKNGWKFKAIRITTPAPGDKTFQGTVKFNIGSMFYTVDNNEFTMDVAPYEKGGRTYLPIRFAATATGVDYENVIWNGASQTVTIINDARVIQLTIGSNEMVVNGTTLYMDAAPEIVDGRTMLPIRFVAQALGKTVDYDATDRAVTIE